MGSVVLRAAEDQFVIVIGDTITNGVPAVGAGNIESPGATDTYTFTATAGQVVYFDEMTGHGCSSRLRWRLSNPGGGVLFDEIFAAIECGTGTDAGARVLTNAGIYTLVVYGLTDAVDTYAFRLVPVVPQNFTVAIGDTITNGVPVVGAGNIESPGATDTYTFTATAGQVVYFDEMTGHGCSPRLRWRLSNPSGGVLFDEIFAAIECGTGTDAGARVLTNAGIYTLVVYGLTDAVDTYAFRLVPVVPQNFTVAIGGTITNGVPAAGAGNIESPGATDTYTFTATAGQVVYFDEMTGHGCSSRLRWRLSNPSGGVLFDEIFAAIECGTGTDAGTRVLTNAGIYTLVVYGLTDAVDTYAFRLVPVVPQNFTVAIGGTVTNGVPAAGAGNIESPGATDIYTFTATAGQVVYFDEITGHGCSSRLRWRLNHPSGGVLFDEIFAAIECGTGTDAGARVLTNAGIYTLVVYGLTDAVDTYAFRLVPVVPQNFAVAIGDTITNGVPAAGAGNIESPGAADVYTFTASAGQVVYFDEMTGHGCFSRLRWRLNDPSGGLVFDEPFANLDACGSGSDAGTRVLTNAGIYTLVVYGLTDAVDTYAFRLVPVVPQNFTVAIGGAVTNGVPAAGAGHIESPGAADVYTFTASAGQVVYFDEMTGHGCSSRLRWRLNNPSGGLVFDEPFANLDACGSGNDAGARVLTNAGTYTLVVYGLTDAVDTYAFRLVPVVQQNFTVAIGGTVTNGVPAAGAGNIESPGATDIYTFTATAGQVVYFDEMTGHGCFTGLRWRLNNPSGGLVFDEPFANLDACGSGTDAGTRTLTNAGTYTLVVYGATDAVDPYAFALHSVTPPEVVPLADRLIHQGGAVTLGVFATASSPVGNPLSYRLVTSPPGAALGTNSGVFTWTAPASSTGDFPVTLRVRDALGFETTVSFNIRVVPAADLAITRLVVPSGGDTESSFNLTYRETNLGSAPATGSWSQRLWLSGDGTLDTSDMRLGEYPFTGTLAPGQFIERSVQFRLPRLSGAYFVIAESDPGADVIEANEQNNVRVAGPILVAPAYSATVQTDVETAVSGTPVVMRGQANRRGGGPAAFESVNIFVKVRGTTRIVSAITDDTGAFAATFRPLLGEAGDYTLGAAHPGEASAPVHDTFRLLGMGFEPNEGDLRLSAQRSVTLSTTLSNRSQVPLTGLSVAILDAPASPNLAVTANVGSVLPADGALPVQLRVNSTADESFAGRVTVQITSSEGARAQFRLNLAVDGLQPRLEAIPGALVAGMLRSNQTVVKFLIRNHGGATSAPVNVLLPPLPWMSIANALPLPPLPPGASNEVALLLQPPGDLALGEHSGAFVLTAGTASTAVPFTFNLLSDALARLDVEVVDEYTYYAQGSPRVAGAKVIVRPEGSLVEVTNQVTDAHGRATFANLREGYYDLEVTADNHSTFRGTTLVLAGRTNALQPFLSRETVRYEFTVVPATIEDRTRIRIETVFETFVPLPVITIDPTQIDLADIQADRTEIDLRITNHGLVAAQDFRLSFISNARWRFTPLQEKLGDLPARSSLSVPLVIERLDRRAGASLQDTGDDDNCGLGGGGCYTLICGTNRNTYCVPVFIPWPCGGEGGGELYLPPSFSGTGGAGSYSPPVCRCAPVPCDPCGGKLANVLLDCVIGFIPLGNFGSCVKDTYSCVTADAGGAALACAQALVSCAELAGHGVPYLGQFLSALDCAIKIRDACQPPAPTGQAAPSLQAATFTDPTFFPGQALVAEHADRLKAIVDALTTVFGDPAWYHPAQGTNFNRFQARFVNASRPTSDAGLRISAAERAALLAGPLPDLVSGAQVGTFLDRWNRTADYADRGILNLAQVPSGESTDFLALDVLRAKFAAAANAVALNESDGFPDDLLAGLKQAIDRLRENLSESGGGICARVRLRLDQDAVVTRSAFNAMLEIVNNADEPLTGLKVELRITDLNGAPADALFGVLPPTLTGLNAINGSGVVGTNATGKVTWLLVPGHEAAPSPSPRNYFVGGFFSYLQEGRVIRVPLAPAPITVHPTPRLTLTYFHERDVRSDDPFTPGIEPSIPYSLAVMARNTGFGTAKDLRIISSEPQIIENEKGLLIDFDLIATEVAGQALTPSLTADFGDVAPGEIKIGRWLFESTLQGQFIDYSATFENIGPLKDFPELSTIDAVSIHEMIHIVRAAGPGFADDGKPDFLVNEVQDDDFLPDRLYLSNGATNPVSVVLAGTFDGAPTAVDLEVQLNVTVPGGWVYLALTDPGQGAFRLARVLRGDGSEVRFGDNAWTTDRTFIAGGRRPRYEHKIHLFDGFSVAGPAVYRLIYQTISLVDNTAPTSVTIALPGSSRAPIPVQWFGVDNTGGSGLAFFDIFVSDNSGPFTRWLSNTTGTGALYPGVSGHRYGFYSVATDRAGNREAAPLTPDTETAINRVNTAPTLVNIAPVTVNEGATARFRVLATDPDIPADVLTYSLGANAPAGALIDSRTGFITWITGEGNGPSTNQWTVTVTDNGIPALSASRSVTVIVNELNVVPSIAPMADQILGEGDLFEFVVPADDPDLPPQPLRFSLGPGAPAGLTLEARSGLLSWQPNELQGPSTNEIIVRVSDGVATAEAALTIVVRNTRGDFELALGSTHVVAGAASSVGVHLNAALDLAEVTFTLDSQEGPLTDFSLVPLAPAVGTASIAPSGEGRFEVRLAAAAGQTLLMNADAARLEFAARPEAASAVVPLSVEELSGRRVGGALLANPRARDGRVIVVGPEPVLNVRATGNRLLLYGHPGDRITLESTASLDGNVVWNPFLQVTLTSHTAEVDLTTTLAGQTGLFIRARR